MLLKLKYFLIVYYILLDISLAKANYNYELIEKAKHRIHLITLDPNEYEISLVSAHDKVFGREKVGEIAKRKEADIAINSGFFEIGNNDDGRPSGTLIIDGKLYGLMKSEHSCLIKRNGKFSIEIIKPELDIEIGGLHLNPYRFNRFISGAGRDIYFYSDRWGASSLSFYNSRMEAILDSNKKVLLLSTSGDSRIPENGYVISLPFDTDVSLIKVGAIAKFNWTPDYIVNSDTSAVLGIPALILNGKIQSELDSKSAHARTAIGLKANNELVIAVVEHASNEAIKDITLGEFKKIINEKGFAKETLNKINLQEILANYLKADDPVIGLTLQELAEFLKSLDCISAINLDGGGSSTMYIDGKYVNQSFVDSDEELKGAVTRPVSDAIIFKKK